MARPASRSDTVQASGVTVPEPVDIPTFDKAGPVKTGPVQLMVFRRVDFGPQQLLPPHRIALMSSRRLLPSPWYDLGLGFPGFLAGDEGKVLTISPGCGGRAHRSDVQEKCKMEI